MIWQKLMKLFTKHMLKLVNEKRYFKIGMKVTTLLVNYMTYNIMPVLIMIIIKKNIMKRKRK